MTKEILEHNDYYKERLQQYLLNKVINKISGRDGLDVTGRPRRSLFAGVLGARFTTSNENIQEKAQTSSLGIDFKIRPNTNKVSISIKPKWCFYYSVFPKWEVVQKHNFGAKHSDSDTDKSTALMLLVAFRRKEVFTTTNIEFNLSGNVKAEVFNLSSIVEKTKHEIENDPDRWYHLGDPKKQIRKLECDGTLNNEKDYYEKLELIRNQYGIQALPNWNVTLHVEITPDITVSDIYRVKMLLSNDTLAFDDRVDDPLLDERAIFDAMLEVEIDGAKIVPFEFLLAGKDYRSNPTMIAKGINCVADKDKSKEKLITDTLPIYDQPLYRTKQDTGVRFESLDINTPSDQLLPIVDSMRLYLEEWNKYIKTDAERELSKEEIDKCCEDKINFEQEINGFLLGIECLKRNKLLNKAFQLMNRAFFQLGQKSGGKIQSWRLFQICFIVSQLSALMARELDDYSDENFKQSVIMAFERASVLWFPTGGGKTEAYLGLIAVSLIFDRLRGKTRGINTWMRFPLRMLSLQQMERLSKVIAELNVLRSETREIQAGDPFSMGYYVGDGVTPNRVSEKDMAYYSEKEENRKKILLLRKCPYCNAKVEVQTDKAHWRIIHKCTNEKCFSNTSVSLGSQIKSLPLYIIDNEIYRYLPSVLVGTVDKLAIAGFNFNFAHLIKGVTQQCPEHGYASYDSCIESYSSGCRRKKKKDLVKLVAVKDPGPSLLIQDELHLLKSDLGVFNGHYEGFLQYVGRNVFLPPKILAATATIESYNHHAFHLYLKASDRFPVPSWRRGESFYATSTPLKKRRKYIGILCHSKAVVDATSALIHIYQHEIKSLKANHQEARNAVNDQSISEAEIDNLLTLYDFSLAYVNKKAIGSNLLDRLEQKNSDLEFAGLSRIKYDLLTGDRNPEDIGIALERIQNEREITSDARLDVVAATSLISHGVDLERINMMTICGMPSHYAEYVQSSSRSARSHPGFVFVCFLSKDVRELSQYEMFIPMHENMDSLIEPVAVNRFASFAPSKTIPGLLSALLINHISPELYKTSIARPLVHVPTLKVALGLQSSGSSGTRSRCILTEDLLTAIEQIIGTDRFWTHASKKEIENIKLRIAEILQDQIALIGRSPENKLSEILKPITSFRDVDQGLEFESLDSSSLVSRV